MTQTTTTVRDGGRDQDFLAPAARLRGAGIGGLEELTDLQRSERLERMRAGELGSIHSWELVTAVDGPGTRMTVFLNGCPPAVSVLPQPRYLPHEGRRAG